MTTPPWTAEEDAYIARCYAQANGAMTPYREMAASLNRGYHGDKPVRKIGAVRTREGVVAFGKSSRQPSLA